MTDEAHSEHILVVEDDAELRETLGALLTAYGYLVYTSPDGRHALRLLQRETVDVVITDLRMPGLGGEALLQQVQLTFPEIPVITITSYSSVKDAVALTRAGAADYLPKPLEMEPMLETIRRVLDESRPRREAAQLQRQHGKQFAGLIGRSRPMLELYNRIGRVAISPAPVLIAGETGTGKELVARAVHGISGRTPFVPVNCGAIPANLLESELFGHVRGAFTGADQDRRGLFEEAHGGTIFLDEIGELPLALQPKLLRILQFGELRRVGETRARQVDVRLIAATHQDVEAAVREGSFREDLYYRINVLQLEVPPLRERAADIPLLAEHFLTEIARREGQHVRRYSSEALAALMAFPWPGNVRELRNVIERTVAFAGGQEIALEDLPEKIRTTTPRSVTHTLIGTELTVTELERQHIVGVLERVGGNRTRAAEVLGMPLRTLYRRLEEYGIGPATERPD